MVVDEEKEALIHKNTITSFMNAPSKIRLTVEDKIALFLMDYWRFNDQFELPTAVTQMGIAEALGIRRSHVSIAVKGLKKRAYVEERMSHVKGEERRRKVYFLTSQGYSYGQRIRESIREKEILFKDLDGEIKSIKCSELSNTIGRKVPLIEIINNISDEGILDHKKLIGKEEATSIDFCERKPELKYFFGREDESKAIMDWLLNPSCKVLVLKGIAGVGKTTLIAKQISKFEKEYNVFWCRLHEWTTERNLLMRLSIFLEKLGQRRVKSHLIARETIDLEEISILLQEEMQKTRILLIFDDYHKVSEPIRQFFSSLFEISEELNNLKIVVIGRYVPPFYDYTQVAVRKLVEEMQIEGLDIESSVELLSLKNIDERQSRKIYELTEGHPLFLELIDSVEDLKGQSDLTRYLREEIYQKLSNDEKRLLAAASVYRYPVDVKAFFVEEDFNYETIDNLVEKSLIQASGIIYNIHDLIREFFYSRISEQTRKSYHAKAANYYAEEAGDLALMETQYHLLKAGKYDEASKLAIEHGPELIRKGYQDELMKIVAEFDEKNLNAETWAKILTLKGEMLRNFGEWEQAMNCYEKSLNLAKELDDRMMVAKSLFEKGVIYYRQGDCVNAIELYRKSLEIFKKLGDMSSVSRIYNSLGVVYWQSHELDKSIEFYIKSLKISKELKDKHGIARAHNNLGIIYWEKGELDKALELYTKGLELSEDLGDKRTVAILYDNIGEVYRLKGDRENAFKFYNDSLNLSEELGFKWQIAEVYRNLGRIYEGEKREDYLKRSLELFEQLGAKKEVEEVRKVMNKG